MTDHLEGSWVFAHELGHVQGCQHNWAVSPTTRIYPYCHAYIDIAGGAFKTVMSYGSVPTVQNYSNPDIEYNGYPTGVAIDAPCDPAANPSSCPAHNALCINNTARIVARHRISDCNRNGVCDAEDVAAGTSPDCNGNGVPDECDPYEDCNGNSVPDLCDINCATTGVPDCDPTNGLCGLSDDCNGNCIPDECDLVASCSGVEPCCSIHASLGCECPSCCAAVCQIDSYCCTTSWDSACAESAAAIPVCACGLTSACLDFDCNENQILDECDITSGTSSDCNANGIPDECEIPLGISQDCNSNGVPDECDNGCCNPNDCGLPAVCCSNECVECCNDSDCAGHPFHPYCRLFDHTCICLTDADCLFFATCLGGTCCAGPGCAQQGPQGP